MLKGIAQKSIDIGDKVIRVAIVPLILWFAPEYLEMRDKMIEINTQWAIMQNVEKELETLKIDVGIMKQLVNCYTSKEKREILTPVKPELPPMVQKPLDNYMKEKIYQYQKKN